MQNLEQTSSPGGSDASSAGPATPGAEGPQTLSTTHRLIACSDVRIHVVEQGAGDRALLFLHYWGGSTRTWRHVMALLAPTYQTVALDHRGWGESDAPELGYALADHAADAACVIEALELADYVLIGHSMGGKIAQLLASHQPPGLAGLVLVGSAPPAPMSVPLDQRRGMVNAYATRSSVEQTIDEVLTAGPLDAFDREQVIEDSLAGAPAAKRAWPLESSQEDIRAAMPRIAVPTLIILGESDRVDTVETTRTELLPHIPASRMVVAPGCGHLSPLEAPKTLSRLIGAFAAGLASSQRTSGDP